MTSLYNQSVPVFIKFLENLSELLKKGEEFAGKDGANSSDILNGRLHEDMTPLPFHVEATCELSETFCNLAGRVKTESKQEEPPANGERKPDSSAQPSFADLQARISATIEFLKSFDDVQMNGAETDEILMQAKTGHRMRFATGQAFLSEFIIPQFFFHLTTAYGIMRNKGVQLGKMDYLKGLLHFV